MRFNLKENAKTCILYIQKGEKIKRKKSILKGNPKAKEAGFMITKFVIKDAHVPAGIVETMERRIHQRISRRPKRS